MKPMELTAATFENETASGVTVVDFWASWCGPCRMLSPIVEELAGEMSGVKFAKVNVDEEGELAAQFSVMSIPLVVLMQDGKLVKSSLGYKSLEALKAELGI